MGFFVWEIAWGKILTMNQLQRRDWFLESYCCMCKKVEESIDFLLIHCGKARTLWHFQFSLFGILWVSLFSERLVNVLEWNFCGQEEKIGMENSSSLPILDNFEGM